MSILPTGLRPHRDLLGLSFLSRLPLSMAGVGILTLGLQRGLGAGLSGTATASYALCFGLAGPFLGRAATRGIPPVLTRRLIVRSWPARCCLSRMGRPHIWWRRYCWG